MSEVYRELSQQEFLDIKKRILFEDNHLLIFNKRSGEIIQADITEDEPLSTTLKAFISQRDSKPGGVYLGVTHRLDRPVSGVVVFAKSSKALGRINEAFRLGEMNKTYLALVSEKPKENEKLLIHYLTRNEKQNKTYASLVPKQGAKEAKLKYKFLKSTDNYHLLEVELYTGRHHQIRAQLSAIGCIIKGDLKYGARRSNPDASICLHSYKLEFTHPVKKEKLEVIAPLIQDSFARCVNFI